MKTAFVCLVSVLPLLILARAQEEQSAQESFIPNYAAGSLHWLRIDRADASGGDRGLEVQQFGVNVPIPLLMDDGSNLRVVAGIRYRWNELKLDGFEPIGGDLNLHRLQLATNFWITGRDERRTFWLRAEPGIHSDFETITSDDFTFTALALCSHQWREDWKVIFGGYFSTDLGRELLLPALGLIWEPNSRWVVSLTAPRVAVTHAPADGWLLRAFAYPGGARWNVEVPETGENLNLEYQAIRLGSSLERNLAGPLWFYVEGGYQLAQEIGFEDRRDVELDDSWWAGTGLKLRF